MHDWVYQLSTADPYSRRMTAEFDSGDSLVNVYNLKDKKVYSVKIKDLSFEFDLVWYENQWRHIMRKNKKVGAKLK